MINVIGMEDLKCTFCRHIKVLIIIKTKIIFTITLYLILFLWPCYGYVKSYKYEGGSFQVTRVLKNIRINKKLTVYL